MIDYSYFHRVADAAFANPFSQRRDDLDKALANPLSRDDGRAPLQQALAELRSRLDGLPGTASQTPEPHRHAVELSVVYALFHDYIDRFDALIAAQEAAGADPVAVPFARDLLGALARSGFTEERSERLLGILWQMRRAYVFVSSSLPGDAPCMRTVRVRLWQNIFTNDMALYEAHLWKNLEDFSLFLVGETGTGKGTAAAAIARSGWIPWNSARARFARSFTDAYVPINLSQFPESLVESELFGHARGAFTGAAKDYDGVFRRGQAHSTIFLDEVGEVSVPVQVKLLRVLQERLFSPVGSHESLRFNGRVVAATNARVSELRGPDRLRDDFYFRLSSDVIEMPPLRQRLAERPSERDQLVRHVLARILGDTTGTVDPMAARILGALDALGEAYPWPGNVRELEQAVRRVLLTGAYDPLAIERPTGRPFADVAEQMQAGTLSMSQLATRYCQYLFDQHGTFEAVARATGLDRRTVKRYLT